MNNRVPLFGLALLLSCGGTVHALDATGQRYTQMLTSGGPANISRAARAMFKMGVSSAEVLDVAAQVLSDSYLKNPDEREFANATAWLCKALGNSGNGRYKALLQQVVAGEIHRRTRGHCEKAMLNLPDGAADTFRPGSVKLTKYRTR